MKGDRRTRNSRQRIQVRKCGFASECPAEYVRNYLPPLTTSSTKGVIVGLDLFQERAPPNIAAPGPLTPRLHVNNQCLLLCGKPIPRINPHGDFNMKGIPVKGWPPHASLRLISRLFGGHPVPCHPLLRLRRLEAENKQIALWSELVSMQMPHLAPQLGSSPNLSCLNAKSPAEC
jgi:hypothetical protein